MRSSEEGNPWLILIIESIAHRPVYVHSTLGAGTAMAEYQHNQVELNEVSGRHRHTTTWRSTELSYSLIENMWKAHYQKDLLQSLKQNASIKYIVYWFQVWNRHRMCSLNATIKSDFSWQVAVCMWSLSDLWNTSISIQHSWSISLLFYLLRRSKSERPLFTILGVTTSWQHSCFLIGLLGPSDCKDASFECMWCNSAS